MGSSGGGVMSSSSTAASLCSLCLCRFGLAGALKLAVLMLLLLDWLWLKGTMSGTTPLSTVTSLKLESCRTVVSLCPESWRVTITSGSTGIQFSRDADRAENRSNDVSWNYRKLKCSSWWTCKPECFGMTHHNVAIDNSEEPDASVFRWRWKLLPKHSKQLKKLRDFLRHLLHWLINLS
jgi:hypothetical protein